MTQNVEMYDFVAKIILVGDASVGKSNILTQFTKNEFSKSSNPTLGVEFGTKILNSNNKKIRLQIWDTAGQEKYKSITNSYYVNSKGAIVVYDITYKLSFEHVTKWINEIKDIAGKDINILLVGNKSDLGEVKRQVSFEEASLLANNSNIDFIETSALENKNIKEAFQILTDHVYDNCLNEDSVNKDELLYNNISLSTTSTNKDLTCKC